MGAGNAEPAVTGKSLWEFSLDFYGREGVPAACIALQDAHGADVDVVLFALWCASRGRRLDASGVAAIDAAVAPWRQSVVQPVRQARRALKPAPSHPFDPSAALALRERLLSAEIEAERLQQGAMEALAPAPGTDDPGPAARHNLACYAEHAGIARDAAPFMPLLQAFA